jgi:hypothetical protein
MTVHRARSARPNAGDRTGTFGQGRDHASDGPISLHGRATPPARGILREPRTKNAWRTAFSGSSLTEGTPNGECRLMKSKRSVSKFSVISIAIIDWLFNNTLGRLKYFSTYSPDIEVLGNTQLLIGKILKKEAVNKSSSKLKFLDIGA